MSIMHSYTMAMQLSLLVLLFLPLPNLTSVEARKFTKSLKNGSVFKVDLIHRNSPLSPYYNSSMTPQERLKRSPLGSISRGHNIQLSSAYYNTSDVTLSNLIPGEGGYLLKIGVGTPEVQFYAIADTGSDLIGVQCSPCQNCISKRSPPFNPNKSSTFQAIPCSTPACSSKPDLLKTGCTSENTTITSTCHYQYYYGGGSTSGILAMESLTLPSSDGTSASLSLPSSIFGCGMNQTVIPEDGIIGLGTGPSSLISQIGSSISYKFSYCLSPLTSEVNSRLAFGGDVMGPGVVLTPFSSETKSTHYLITLDGVSVGDEDVPVPAGLDMIIDSGTTLTMLPASVYGSIKLAIKTAIGRNTVSSPVKYYDLCYISDEQFSPPDVLFRFRGADVVLKAINTFVTFEQYGVTCLAMVATENTFIFGCIAQINFEVGYDLQAKQISFLPADCTKTI